MRNFWLSSYEPEVRRELFCIGHHNLLVANVAWMVVVPVVALASAPHASQRLSLWLTLALGADAIGWAVWALFRNAARAGTLPSPSQVRRWMWAHIAAMGAMGAAAGCLGVLYEGASGTTVLFLAAAFQGSLAFSAAGNATHHLAAFLTSLLVATLLMSGFIPRGFGDQASAMIVMCWLYALILTWVAFESHRSIIETIRLRLHNEQLAQEHAQAASAARRANEDKSAFLAAASHDLRQPVHALMLLIEALRQVRNTPSQTERLDGRPGKHTDDRQDDLIGRIGEAGRSISHMFNELMELSRLESGQYPMLPSLLRPAPLVARLYERHQALAAQNGGVLRLRVGRNAQVAWVHTDPVIFERLVANLLSNALQHARGGKVLLSLRLQGAALLLGIHDNGVGIAAADQERIFEPYVQVANPERDRRKGLGLGLAIVKQGLQRSGLSMQLRSALGRGSHFVIRLPTTEPAPEPTWETTAALGPNAHQPRPAPGIAALVGRHVLLVDDDPLVRDAMADVLAGWGMVLRSVPHGADPSLDTWHSDGWSPDLVLCDYRLPGRLTGLDVLDLLQQRWPAAIGVLQTGEPRERVHAAAETSGYPVLYKPVPPAILATTLQALLRTGATELEQPSN